MSSYDQKKLAYAIQIAVEAHGYVINKDGTPYILHPLRLMLKTNNYHEQIVAILHDTIEDTSLELEDLGWLDFWCYSAIEALTKQKGEEYEDFIERIAKNKLATKVKLLDLYDNIDVTRLPELGDWELKRTAKYHKAILRLKKALEENQFEDGIHE